LRCDLLVVNKVDLAPYVRVDLPLMLKEANEVRGGRPVIATNAWSGEGIEAVMDMLEREVLFV
jgi:urease accessory protein